MTTQDTVDETIKMMNEISKLTGSSAPEITRADWDQAQELMLEMLSVMRQPPMAIEIIYKSTEYKLIVTRLAARVDSDPGLLSFADSIAVLVYLMLECPK